MHRYISIILMAALVFATLPGCASKYGEQQTQVNYYPGCYQPIQDLRDQETNTAKSTGFGALAGALTGALVGLLVSGGKWQGAVMGGAGGAAIGSVAGNIYAKKQEERDNNRRLASYLQDMNGDISNVDIVSGAARTSLDCYDRQFQILLSQIRSGAISREAAAQRYAEISAGREEAINLLGNTADYATNLNQEYEQAFMQEEQNLQTSPQMATRSEGIRQIRAGRQRNQAFTQRAANLKQEQSAAQDNSIRQTREINDAFSDIEEARQDIKA